MQESTLGELSRDVDVPDYRSETAMRSGLRVAGFGVDRLGQLEDLGIWLAGVQDQAPPREPTRARLVIFAGDHGIRAAGVSSQRNDDSAAEVLALLDGTALSARLADLHDVGVRVADLGVAADTRPDVSLGKVGFGSARIDETDALSPADVSAALERGAAIADEEIDGGADLLLLGDVGVASTTTAAALICVLTATEPVKVVGRAAGIDDTTWMRKVTAIRDARLRAMPRRHDLDDLLAAIGSADIAAMTGFVLRAAVRRTPVVLDGVVTGAAALLAREVDPRAQRWVQAALLTAEPAHAIALERLRLEPITVRGVESGQGAGAVLAVPMLRAAARAMADVAIVEEPEPLAEPEPFTGPEPVLDPEPDAGPEPEPELEPEAMPGPELEPGTDADVGGADGSHLPPTARGSRAVARTRPQPAVGTARRVAGSRRRKP